MNLFRRKLMEGAIPIHQSDQDGTPLRQFDEVLYEGEKYIIIWNPIYEEFVGSHHTGNWIPFLWLNRVKYIKNLKACSITTKS